MNIFVINLKKNIERKEFIQEQFNKIEVAFNFFPAIFGKSLTKHQLDESYNHKKAIRHQCRSLVPAEIGCALSHIGIYKKIIEERIEFACILEDDVILPENFKEILEEIKESINNHNPEVILLSPAKTGKFKWKLKSGYEIRKFKNGFYTSSYIVNYLGAKALLKEMYPINDVADCWLRLSWHKVVDINVVVPALVTQDQEKFGSSTTVDINQNNQYSLSKKIKFKLCRALWLSFDYVLAIYHRNFRPYSGVLKLK